ncbi:spermidine/putrescine transport system permease protein [Agromyces hippuratus]|uniref:Spermidine/putrescine transport system permease protein n=1 Tax=Agromyces hippuratus TaxID=286438 RepID=A0A852WW92_9MICO|nr:ABC transporter permease [Agromyces hippuratus]NYG21907.1 spermidine/putrescine transport system permease protein [Agromyces hippuratus]
MVDTTAPTTTAMREIEPSARPRAVRKPRGILVPLWLGYVFLYLPILIVVIMSFNASENLFVWKGFSLRWYPELFADEKIMQGLGNTLIVATGATAIATVLGTLLAYGIQHYTRGGLIRAFAIAPAILPDLLLGIGLLTLFSLASVTLGLHSVILAHGVFATAFVTAIVLARMANLDPSLEEASRDLGAGAVRTFMRVTLPQLAPGIVAGALLAFTLSIDEFVIAFFTTAPTQPTLPIVIYSMVRFGVTPEVNALATILLLVSVVTVIAAQRLTRLTGTTR